MFPPGTKVLEVGGGSNPRFRPNLDARAVPGVDLVCDLNERWPIQGASYSGIYSAYVIEHLSWRKVKGFIVEVHRVLSPGGTAIVVTSNLLEQCRKLVTAPVWTENMIEMLFGSQEFGDQWWLGGHHNGFSPEYVKRLFKQVGFAEVQVQPHPQTTTDMIIVAKKAP